MSASIFIYGGKYEQRLNKALEMIQERLDKKFTPDSIHKFVDIKAVEQGENKASIGIDQAKDAIIFTREKPFEFKGKVILFTHAEKLTTEAQNALLKTLEEPPSYVTAILLAKTERDLLETVVSRCKKYCVNTGSEVNLYKGLSIFELVKSTPGDRLAFVANLPTEKEELTNVLEAWLVELRAKITSPNAANTACKLTELTHTIDNYNVNVKLALESFVLSI